MGHTNVFGNHDAATNLATKDVTAARRFYEQTLGLEPVHHEGEELVVYRSGTSTLNLYRSEYAGTNKATAVTWLVDDVDPVVRALAVKGVKFERYDLPHMTKQGDVYVGDDMKIAWFKDPDGNIHAITSRMIREGAAPVL